ncbi:MAG: protein kinase [Pyrinomonadaceae bacterium]
MELTHLIGQTLDEKYLIESELGRGGMGAVYLAMHVGTDRPVALKVIAPQFMEHAEFVERFRREARAAGRLRHPNVVDVTDFGFARVGQERVAYLVMEYLDGCTLAEVLAEESRLPLEWVVDILEQTCSALDEAHRQGIIHRDLKPDNIWLEPNHRGGYTVKVLDFGIAKLADSAEIASAQAANVSTSASASSIALAQELPTLITNARVADEKAMSAAADSSSSHTAKEAARETELTESDTLALPNASAGVDLSEAATQIQQSASETDRTRILEHRTTGDQQRALSTASTDGLTRVGATLGTPFYMSPEQWRGETLDTRADIYSLGVIAYQMLSGQTPFKGDFATVRRQHQEEPPPPLKEKRVPKKVEQAVMSALSKSPDERPANAGAFASALRANSEGAAILLRRAIALYSEHLPVFLRLVLLVYIPLFIVNVLQLSFNIAEARGLVSKNAALITGSILLSLLQVLCAFVTAAVVIGITTRLVTQLLAAPLRPIQLRTAFAALRKRLKPFFGTTLMVSLLTMIGMILLVIPGLYMMVHYSMVTPTVMMEDTKGRAALRRSKTLVKRSRRTVIFIVFIQFFMPIMSAGVLAFLVISLIKMLHLQGGQAHLFGNIYQIVSFPINALILSFSAVITALLYLKTRQAGGETLTEALGQFEDEELPRRNWQLRMRERLHTTVRQTRHTT